MACVHSFSIIALYAAVNRRKVKLTLLENPSDSHMSMQSTLLVIEDVTAGTLLA
jgi:hypothetical protein